MLFKSQHLDHTALSNNGVPLPACETESVLLFCADVYFRFSIKQVQGFVSSPRGAFYLTTLRLIYVPAEASTFQSFSMPLTQISTVNAGAGITCRSDAKRAGSIVLNFKSPHSDLYYAEIAKAVRAAGRAHLPDSDREDSNTLPYYSDICDIE